MKGYLFDENLPVQLRFSPKLPLIHASRVGRNPTDSQIWNFARSHDLAIVSKDYPGSMTSLETNQPC
jgi:predicted nuclease of predicted toxin-antitoxin system